MKDRVHRPPPLELAPPKRMTTVAVSVGRRSTMKTAHTTSTAQNRSTVTTTTLTRRPSGNPTYLSWIQLSSDAIQIHICAALVAALGTFLYQVPSAAGTSIGSTALAAVTLLTLSISLSFLSMFRPHTPPNPWALLIRLILAFSFIAIFLAWVSQVPGPRVFTPGYELWTMPPEVGNGLAAAIIFLLGVAEFARAVVWRHTLLGEVGSWRHRPRQRRHRSNHAPRERRAPERVSQANTLSDSNWPLETTTTNTSVTPAPGNARGERAR